MIKLSGRNRRRINKIIRPFIVIKKRFLYREILVLGDSHINVFGEKKFREEFPDLFFNTRRVGGATISGLRNPNSGTKALPIFKKELKKTTAKIVIVLMGEVDMGFVIWYRAEKHKSSIEEMYNQAVENYEQFLLDITRSKGAICISTPLPTIQDGNDWGEVAKLRKEVTATQKERTELTLRFNKRIQEICKEIGVRFISLDEESLGKNGLVNPCLLSADRNDHHYDKEKYAMMIIKKLKPLLPNTAETSV